MRLAVLIALYGAAHGSVRGEAVASTADDPPHPRRTSAAAPMLLFDRAAIRRSGLVSLGDFLQQLPMTGASRNSRQNFASRGEVEIELGVLGAGRTLVLVDGRRFVTSLTGVADLSTIPLALVDRIEVLPPDAAARYGADGVAGAINVVLARDAAGAEAHAQLGGFDEGGGRTEAYDFTIGASTGRASAGLAASWTKQSPIFEGDRAISAVPLFGFAANDASAGASSTTPFGRFGFGSNGMRLLNGAPGTLTLIPGRPGDSPGDYRPFDARGDGYNFAPEQYLQTPYETGVLLAHARHELGAATTFRAAMLYDERRSEQRVAPFPFAFGVAGSGLARVMIPASALYNPFGAEVTRAQFRPAVLPRRFTQDIDTFRFDAGLDGSADAFGRVWHWWTGYVYADAEARDVAFGLYDLRRIRDALGPSFRDASGAPRCGTPAAPIAGCIPLDIFSGPTGFTAAMADSVSFVAQDTRGREQHLYDASLATELFELPAGPLGLAGFFEYRREAGFDQPDALIAAGGTTSAVRPPTRGRFSTDDVELAIDVPLLTGVTLAESLALEAAIRSSDHSTFGETTSVRYGFRWQPFESVLLHGAYAEGHRAPSIAELFEGSSLDFPVLLDPCGAGQLRDHSTPVVVQRCRAGFGGLPPVPIGYEQHNSQYVVTRGGNPRLGPELARATRLGLRWLPGFAPSLDVWLDYSDLRIRDVIGFAPVSTVLQYCYFGGYLDFCRAVRREPNGNPTDETYSGHFNLPREDESVRWDLGARYALDSAYGELAGTLLASYLDRHSTRQEPSRPRQPAVPEPSYVGTYRTTGEAYHRLRATFELDWRYRDFGASAMVRYRSALDESCSVRFLDPARCSNPGGTPQFPSGENRLDAATNVDFQMRWDTPWDGRIALGLRNAFGADPPVSTVAFSGNFDRSYDLPGRHWYVSYSQQF